MIQTKKVVGIFDLDGTMGLKTPTFPNVTPLNGDFMRYFSSLDNTHSILATGRPRSQAYLGLSKGNITKKDINLVFDGCIYEDGLFVQDGNGVIYNALNEASEEFKRLKSAFFERDAIQFFKENQYALFSGCVIKQNGSELQMLDYDEKSIGRFDSSQLVHAKNGVLYEQGNDVRATYKAPIGYMNDDVQKQKPFFEALEPLVNQLMHLIHKTPEEHATLVKWEDSLEIYPILGAETFRKGVGVEMILDRIDPNRDASLVFCCDGKNDMSLIDHLGDKYSDHLIIMPKNASSDLVKKVEEHNKIHGIKGYKLKEDCTTFGVGALKLMQEVGYLR